MLGAYGSAMRTAFNGFGNGETVVTDDEPMESMYIELEAMPAFVANNVVKL